MRTVVGGVHDDGVVGDAEFVEQIQQVTDEIVVIEHRVVVLRLPAPGAANALGLGMSAEMHVRRVEPNEERLAFFDRLVDEGLGVTVDLVVDGLHALRR